MEYGLHSGFNPKLHKQTSIHYLEVIIDENGKIMYAVPSHQENMIKLACGKLNVTREELYAMLTEEYYFDFVTWLCKVSGACAVWNNHIESYKLSKEQIKSLKTLKNNGLCKGNI